jgi:TolA-binding protein
MDLSSRTNRISSQPNDENDQNQEINTRNERLRNVHDSPRSLNTQRADSHTNERQETTLRTNEQSSRINEQDTPLQKQSHENDRTNEIHDSTNDASVPTKGSAPWPTPNLSSPILQLEHEDEDDDIDELSIMYQPRQEGNIQRQAYHATLDNLLQGSSFHMAFNVAQERVHQRDLPLAPTSEKGLNTHQYRQEFIEAKNLEFHDLA